MGNENKVVINEELIRKLIILISILGVVILLMIYAIMRLQMSYICFYNTCEIMEFNNFVRFRLPYFVVN